MTHASMIKENHVSLIIDAKPKVKTGKVYYGNYDNEVTGEIRAAVIEGLAHILEGK